MAVSASSCSQEPIALFSTSQVSNVVGRRFVCVPPGKTGTTRHSVTRMFPLSRKTSWLTSFPSRILTMEQLYRNVKHTLRINSLSGWFYNKSFCEQRVLCNSSGNTATKTKKNLASELKSWCYQAISWTGVRKQVNCTAQPTPRNLVVQPSCCPHCSGRPRKNRNRCFSQTCHDSFAFDFPGKKQVRWRPHTKKDRESKHHARTCTTGFVTKRGGAGSTGTSASNSTTSTVSAEPTLLGLPFRPSLCHGVPVAQRSCTIESCPWLARNCRSTPGALGSSLESSSPTRHAERAARCIPTTIV